MIIVDTNILLRLVLDDNDSQTALARQCLAEAEAIALSVHVVCEYVWVLSRAHRFSSAEIAMTIRLLLEDERIICDREAMSAGLAFLTAGGDFADGVIEHEGRSLGGRVFVTFDRRAAATVVAMGRACRLLRAH